MRSRAICSITDRRPTTYDVYRRLPSVVCHIGAKNVTCRSKEREVLELLLFHLGRALFLSNSQQIEFQIVIWRGPTSPNIISLPNQQWSLHQGCKHQCSPSPSNAWHLSPAWTAARCAAFSLSLVFSGAACTSLAFISGRESNLLVCCLVTHTCTTLLFFRCSMCGTITHARPVVIASLADHHAARSSTCRWVLLEVEIFRTL